MVEVPLRPVRETNGFLAVNHVRQLNESNVVTPVGVNESGMNENVTDYMDAVVEVRDVQISVSHDDGDIAGLLVEDT